MLPFVVSQMQEYRHLTALRVRPVHLAPELAAGLGGFAALSITVDRHTEMNAWLDWLDRLEVSHGPLTHTLGHPGAHQEVQGPGCSVFAGTPTTRWTPRTRSSRIRRRLTVRQSNLGLMALSGAAGSS